MACSTWFPRGIVDTPSPANAKLPVMLCHGEVDPIAKVEWSSKVCFFFLFFPGMLCHGEVDPIAKVEWSIKVCFQKFFFFTFVFCSGQNACSCDGT